MKDVTEVMLHVLIQAEDGLIGPGATYQDVKVFASYDDAWNELLRRFNEFGGNGELNEEFGNGYCYTGDGMLVWQIITDPFRR